ncbi:MAG: DUF4440 domain-containing protein [Solirubrobacterales bacterium]
MNPHSTADLAKGPLRELERELAAGDGATYARRLREDAIVIVPSRALDKAETITEIDNAGGWDGFTIDQVREESLAADSAIVTYRFQAHRGSFEYTAWLSSVYTREADEWKLLLHQQTPLE